MEIPAVAQELLCRAQVHVVDGNGHQLLAPSALVAAAFVLRKLAVLQADGSYQVRVLDGVVAEHVAAYLLCGDGVEALLRWAAAADFLLAEPPAHLRLSALLAALGSMLQHPARVAPRAVTRGDSADSSMLSELIACSHGDGYDLDIPARKSHCGSKKSPDDACLVDDDDDGDGDSKWTPAELLNVTHRLGLVAQEVTLATHVIVSTLLVKCAAGAGALQILHDVDDVLSHVGVKLARWLVHRALRTLYVEECAGGGGAGRSVPVADVARLQAAYARGALTLGCFMPYDQRKPPVRRWLLQGARTACELHAVQSDLERIKAKVQWLVPWLALVRGVRLFLSGSMLCFAMADMHASAPDPSWPGPADVDVFCLTQEELPEAAARIGEAMRYYASFQWQSHSFEDVVINASHRVLRVAGADGGAPAPWQTCDLYVSSPARVLRYHLPQVRACLDVQAADLFISPSCCIALACGVNVDYQLVCGKKTPHEVVANKWLWGYNMALQHFEYILLQSYLRSRHGEAFARAQALKRPTSVQFQSYEDFECAYAT